MFQKILNHIKLKNLSQLIHLYIVEQKATLLRIFFNTNQLDQLDNIFLIHHIIQDVFLRTF
jgi:hypothetical protein